MHELVEAVIEKYKMKHREVEEYLRGQEETQIIYTPKHIKMLVDSGKISKELGEWFFKDLDEMNNQYQEKQKFIKDNPNIPPEEFNKHFHKMGPLSPEESAKLYEDMYLSSQLFTDLLKNRHLLTEDSIVDFKQKALFKDIDISEEFGIASCISNSIYHLTELLNTMSLTNLYGNEYAAKSSVKNTKGEAISLTYLFPASTKEEANAILKNYQKTMVSKGLKVWMAHWMMANKLGRIEYACPMFEIMKLIADEGRESFFSVKEKEEHWALTNMLSASKLSRERIVKKRGCKEIIQWIEQPLLEILGGEKEMTAEDKYPIAIAIRVLMPRIDKNGFSPTIYKNNTTLLSSSDLLLAFILQTRASQRGHGSKNLHFDWDFIFEAGNLQTTAISNQRGARAKARKKMDRLQQSEIIERWDEEFMGVCVTPKKQKKIEKAQLQKITT